MNVSKPIDVKDAVNGEYFLEVLRSDTMPIPYIGYIDTDRLFKIFGYTLKMDFKIHIIQIKIIPKKSLTGNDTIRINTNISRGQLDHNYNFAYSTDKPVKIDINQTLTNFNHIKMDRVTGSGFIITFRIA